MSFGLVEWLEEDPGPLGRTRVVRFATLMVFFLATSVYADARPRVAQLLERDQAALERMLGASTGTEAGWVRYGSDVAVKMERGISSRVRVRVAADTCRDLVVAEGFADAGHPHRRRDTCEWPGISTRHQLDARRRLAARLDLSTATLEVWVR